MFYERKIKYLDYLVKQEKCGNAGFIKLEVRDTICNITINVNNLRATDSFPVKVYVVGEEQEKELCSLELVQGKGRKQLLKQDVQDLAHTGIGCNILEAVKIPISADREIVGVLKEKKEVQNSDSGKSMLQKPILESMGEKEELVGQVQAIEVVEDIKVAETVESIDTVKSIETVESVEAVKVVESIASVKVVMEKQAEEVSGKASGEVSDIVTKAAEYTDMDDMVIRKVKDMETPLYDNKWSQLWAIYPHIAPFHDEREYLSVGPGDFVILPQKYFQMANNSFLLHGYYNYKHLVLKRMEYRGQVKYYIGVPGNFYDREKQVAVMFGFESFESLEEPARTGDYGYYMMRIEL